MNIITEDVLANSCHYAPVYLIQDPGAIQANTYVLAPHNVDQQNPVANNLKTFYESSGNIENDLINISNPVSVLKKREGQGQVGNNLKLASFLMPKNDNVNKQYVLNNIVLKPATSTNTSSAISTAPKIDIHSKIVKLKDVPVFNRKGPERRMPKIKPKNPTSLNSSKYTSVQLIKLGETYHSLNKLSDEQIKLVNQALKMFDDPDKTRLEPTYDPVTNTQYIYKVVSPKDLAVVGKRRLINKDKKVHTKLTKKVDDRVIHMKHVKKDTEKELHVKKIEPSKKVEDKDFQTKPVKKLEERVTKQLQEPEVVENDEPEPVTEATVTRSGRKVKLPKQILPQDSPQKAKRRNGTIVHCFQCSADFGSLYRLQKHYENHPTHIPAKIHSNLFHCLLAIIKSGSEGDKANIFIQQLEQLVVKLKSLLPCLLKKVDGTEGQSCTINDDVGRLFGMNAGKYNIDVDALNCVKDKNGYCIHNPPKLKPLNKDPKNKLPSDSTTDDIDLDNESENCARINPVAKWPTVSKRIWKLKQQTQEMNAKKIRLQSEGLNDCGTINVSEIDNIPVPSNIETSTVDLNPMTEIIVNEPQDNNNQCSMICPPTNTERCNIERHSENPKNNHIQFHSAHFDIRSSPIKSSSTVFRKFQINASKFVNYESQPIRSLAIDDKEQEKDVTALNDDNSLHDIFKNDVDLSCKASNVTQIDPELKEWIMNVKEKSQDSFTKSSIEPALIHVKDNDKALEKDLSKSDVDPAAEVDNLSNQTESVLNFLEELDQYDLVYPETEIRNSGVDFHLDLFTFNNT